MLEVLGLLRCAAMDEWEMLDAIYRAYGVTPDAKAVGGLVRSLLGSGMLRQSYARGKPTLTVTKSGFELLSELTDEYEKLMG